MPASYAHIALVNDLSEVARLERWEMPVPTIQALCDHFKFCELGAISPDYPYLALANKRANVWADYMHYDQTVEIIRAGIRHLKTMEGNAWMKGMAWLLGYAAHVATDAAIHPVVKLRVGPYYANPTEHRLCEMHQDAYIWPRRMNVGEVGASEHLTSGIGRCGDSTDAGRLDPDVEALWRAMLREAHPVAYAANPPDPHQWRRGFQLVVDQVAEEGGSLFPFARHVASGLGLMYPAAADVDQTYLRNLKVPGGGAHDYDWIFDWAIERVGTLWKKVADAVCSDDDAPLREWPNWNLDIGCEETLVYWR